MLVRDGIVGAPRVARHLWRMCFALFIAAGSLFLGQQKVFPASWRGSPILRAPPLLTLILMVFWIVRVSFTNAFKGAYVATSLVGGEPPQLRLSVQGQAALYG